MRRSVSGCGSMDHLSVFATKTCDDWSEREAIRASRIVVKFFDNLDLLRLFPVAVSVVRCAETPLPVPDWTLVGWSQMLTLIVTTITLGA